jgi:hypothetical protein
MAERESREIWAKRVERWLDSGLTAAQYEGETGVSARRLAYWKWSLKAEGDRKTEPTESASFVEVVAAPVVKKAAAVKLEPLDVIVDEDGLRIRVPLHFDPAALHRLISALEKR